MFLKKPMSTAKRVLNCVIKLALDIVSNETRESVDTTEVKNWIVELDIMFIIVVVTYETAYLLIILAPLGIQCSWGAFLIT